MGAACMVIANFWNFHEMIVIGKIFKAVMNRKNECWCHLYEASVVIVSNWPLGSKCVVTAKVGNHFKWLTIKEWMQLALLKGGGLWVSSKYVASCFVGNISQVWNVILLFIFNCPCGPVGSIIKKKKCSHGSISCPVFALWDWTHQLEGVVVIPNCKEGAVSFLLRRNSEVVVIYEVMTL